MWWKFAWHTRLVSVSIYSTYICFSKIIKSSSFHPINFLDLLLYHLFYLLDSSNKRSCMLKHIAKTTRSLTALTVSVLSNVSSAFHLTIFVVMLITSSIPMWSLHLTKVIFVFRSLHINLVIVNPQSRLPQLWIERIYIYMNIILSTYIDNRSIYNVIIEEEYISHSLIFCHRDNDLIHFYHETDFDKRHIPSIIKRNKCFHSNIFGNILLL